MSKLHERGVRLWIGCGRDGIRVYRLGYGGRRGVLGLLSWEKWGFRWMSFRGVGSGVACILGEIFEGVFPHARSRGADMLLKEDA